MEDFSREEVSIRLIRKDDNVALANIVRESMKEFKADPATTIIGDPSLNTMFENYRESRSRYFVVEMNGQLAGGCGIARLPGGEETICELQRMFLAKGARGKGIGKALLGKCIDDAAKMGYELIYLETLEDMLTAIGLYESAGFRRIDQALGNTGHTGCPVRMTKKLKNN